jgi:hypothetical protein
MTCTLYEKARAILAASSTTFLELSEVSTATTIILGLAAFPSFITYHCSSNYARKEVITFSSGSADSAYHTLLDGNGILN